MSYIKPRSLTFWAGVLSILSGLILGVHDAYPLGTAGDVIQNWIGSAPPSILITNGLGLIGLRRAVAP